VALAAVLGLHPVDASRSVFWLDTTTLVLVAVFSFAVTLLQYRYIFFWLPALFILASVALTVAWQKPTRRWLWRGAGVISILAAVWHGELILRPQPFFALESDQALTDTTYRSITPQPNFAAAYEFIAGRYTTGDIIISPYPTIHQLYHPDWPQQCVYIDLTGLAPEPPTASERYTVCAYVTQAVLQHTLTAHHGYIILDQFANQRIAPELLRLIQDFAQPQLITSGYAPYSELTVYHY
jgi:hypothetical protein